MKDWVTRIGIIALLAIIVGVPLAFRKGHDRPWSPNESGDRLVIISPHNEQIRFEFGRAFNRWRHETNQTAVEFDWRTSGGTSDLRRMVIDQFTAAAKDGREAEGIGYDLFFGGGEYDHNKLAAGIQVVRNGQEKRIQIVEGLSLPDGLMNEAFPEPRIGGERLFHPELKWIGTALASFGIVYNRDVLAMLGLGEPLSWADLGDPRYRGWVALADPAHSGSISATYNTILRRLGWDKGWKTLRRIFANARYFASGAPKVPIDVSSGEAAAGMCIDFYGRFQSGAVTQTHSEVSRVGYVDPPFETAITADPITLLRGAPRRHTATQFIEWLLSVQAQHLWQLRRETVHGPEKFELRRLPIRRDVYASAEKSQWADPHVTPFDIAKPFPTGMPNMFGTVAMVSHTMAIDIHDDLVKAWEAIVLNPNHPRRDRMHALFDRMPPPLDLTWPDETLARDWADALEDDRHARHDETVELLNDFISSITGRWRGDPDRKIKDRRDWTLFFRANYRKVVKLAERS